MSARMTYLLALTLCHAALAAQEKSIRAACPSRLEAGPSA